MSYDQTVFSNLSFNLGISSLAFHFFGDHGEGVASLIDGSSYSCHRLHAVPRNHACQDAIWFQHNVPVQGWAGTNGSRVEDVDTAFGNFCEGHAYGRRQNGSCRNELTNNHDEHCE